jgi:hypothetical protein
MDRYSTQNAVDVVNGYFTPRPGESSQSAFLRAKVESLSNIQRYVENIGALTYETFLKITRRTDMKGNNHAG